MGSNHPLGRAVVYAILFCAVTHIAISFFVGVMHGNLYIMSMFHILGFDLLWPRLAFGAVNALLGVLLVIAIWAVIAAFLWQQEKKKTVKKPNKKEKVAEK